MLMPAGSGDLYEKRKGVYPKAVDGFYRRFKWAVMAVTRSSGPPSCSRTMKSD